MSHEEKKREPQDVDLQGVWNEAWKDALIVCKTHKENAGYTVYEGITIPNRAGDGGEIDGLFKSQFKGSIDTQIEGINNSSSFHGLNNIIWGLFQNKEFIDKLKIFYKPLLDILSELKEGEQISNELKFTIVRRSLMNFIIVRIIGVHLLGTYCFLGLPKNSCFMHFTRVLARLFMGKKTDKADTVLFTDEYMSFVNGVVNNFVDQVTGAQFSADLGIKSTVSSFSEQFVCISDVFEESVVHSKPEVKLTVSAQQLADQAAEQKAELKLENPIKRRWSQWGWKKKAAFITVGVVGLAATAYFAGAALGLFAIAAFIKMAITAKAAAAISGGTTALFAGTAVAAGVRKESNKEGKQSNVDGESPYYQHS